MLCPKKFDSSGSANGLAKGFMQPLWSEDFKPSRATHSW